MTAVLILMISGIILGLATGKYSQVLYINERLLNFAIYILLLLLGIAVGSNEKIINNLYLIGFQALIITIGAIAGSVILCWLIYKTFFHVKPSSTIYPKKEK
jgi:uncharacterized membrane protein YbjE (DUF340 family)